MAIATVQIPVTVPDGEADCARCVERLGAALAGQPGLLALEVTGPATVRVVYDPDRCSLSNVTTAADAVGVELGRRFAHRVLPITGPHGPDCAQTIERAVDRVGGVFACSVSLAGEVVRVEYDPDTPDVLAAVGARVSSLGYRIAVPAAEEDERSGAGGFSASGRRALVTGASALILLAAVVASAAGADGPAVGLSAAAIAVGGVPMFRSGLAAFRATGRPAINLLMSIAVLGAVALGAWLEAALVVGLFSVGETLQRYAIGRVRRILAAGVVLTPERARVRRDDVEVDVAARELVVGDVVVVHPGELFPADGVVLEGEGAVDQRPITGESIPVDKAPGDMVFAGTLNGEGVLAVRVDHGPGHTTLARNGLAVVEARSRKAPAERRVDAFCRVYIPVAVAVAAVVALVPPIVGLGEFRDWVYRAVVLLVLAGPYGLALATSVSVVAALSRASAAGVLVRSGGRLETAAGVRAVAFGRTGALTVGRPKVEWVVCLASRTERQVLRLAASLEAASHHPVARAILAAAAERGVTLGRVQDVAVRRGFGVEGTLDGYRFRVGTPRLFAGHPDIHAAGKEIARLESEGCTVVIVGDKSRIAGLLGLNDTVRPGARPAIDALRQLGVDRIVLLTGAQRTPAGATAGESGVDEVRAELSAEDKLAAVADLAGFYGSVALVSDVHDAPALARSSLGVALGSASHPSAIGTADVAVMADDSANVAGLIGLSRWTRAVGRQNIVFCLAAKAIAAGFAVVGLLPLWLAVLANLATMLLVVGNSLRLFGGRPGGRLHGLPNLEPVRGKS